MDVNPDYGDAEYYCDDSKPKDAITDQNNYYKSDEESDEDD